MCWYTFVLASFLFIYFKQQIRYHNILVHFIVCHVFPVCLNTRNPLIQSDKHVGYYLFTMLSINVYCTSFACNFSHKQPDLYKLIVEDSIYFFIAKLQTTKYIPSNLWLYQIIITIMTKPYNINDDDGWHDDDYDVMNP